MEDLEVLKSDIETFLAPGTENYRQRREALNQLINPTKPTNRFTSFFSKPKNPFEKNVTFKTLTNKLANPETKEKTREAIQSQLALHSADKENQSLLTVASELIQMTRSREDLENYCLALDILADSLTKHIDSNGKEFSDETFKILLSNTVEKITPNENQVDVSDDEGFEIVKSFDDKLQQLLSNLHLDIKSINSNQLIETIYNLLNINSIHELCADNYIKEKSQSILDEAKAHNKDRLIHIQNFLYVFYNVIVHGLDEHERTCISALLLTCRDVYFDQDRWEKATLNSLLTPYNAKSIKTEMEKHPDLVKNFNWQKIASMLSHSRYQYMQVTRLWQLVLINGDIELIGRAIKTELLTPKTSESMGTNAIHWLAWCGYENIISELVAKHKFSLTEKDLSNSHAVHYAALGGHTNLMEKYNKKLSMPIISPNTYRQMFSLANTKQNQVDYEDKINFGLGVMLRKLSTVKNDKGMTQSLKTFGYCDDGFFSPVGFENVHNYLYALGHFMQKRSYSTIIADDNGQTSAMSLFTHDENIVSYYIRLRGQSLKDTMLIKNDFGFYEGAVAFLLLSPKMFTQYINIIENEHERKTTKHKLMKNAYSNIEKIENCVISLLRGPSSEFYKCEAIHQLLRGHGELIGLNVTISFRPYHLVSVSIVDMMLSRLDDRILIGMKAKGQTITNATLLSQKSITTLAQLKQRLELLTDDQIHKKYGYLIERYEVLKEVKLECGDIESYDLANKIIELLKPTHQIELNPQSGVRPGGR